MKKTPSKKGSPDRSDKWAWDGQPGIKFGRRKRGEVEPPDERVTTRRPEAALVVTKHKGKK